MLTSTSVGFVPVPEQYTVYHHYSEYSVLTRSELFIVSTPKEIVQYLGDSGSHLLFGDVAPLSSPHLLPFSPPDHGLITKPVVVLAGLHGVTEITVDIAALQPSKIQQNKVEIEQHRIIHQLANGFNYLLINY